MRRLSIAVSRPRFRRPIDPVLDAILRSGVDSGDAGMRERAVFYARCSVLEDLAYGHDNVRTQYVEKSLAAFGWLFEG